MANNFRSPANVLRRLKMAPLAIRKIKSWPRFMFNYAFGFLPQSPYVFRNGARLKLGRALDHAAIVEIFLREDYGAVPDDGVILDLGANIGAFSCYAAAVARDVTIYAYEPLPDFFRLMQDNIRLNQADNTVRCFNVAIGDVTQDRDIFVQGAGLFFPSFVGGREGMQKIRVPCTTLADIFETNALTRVGLLKIDCEGAEYEILYNTPQRYTDRIEQIRMEYHDLTADRCNRDSLLDFLQSRNYRIERIQANERVSGTIWARKK